MQVDKEAGRHIRSLFAALGYPPATSISTAPVEDSLRALVDAARAAGVRGLPSATDLTWRPPLVATAIAEEFKARGYSTYYNEAYNG